MNTHLVKCSVTLIATLAMMGLGLAQTTSNQSSDAQTQSEQKPSGFKNASLRKPNEARLPNPAQPPSGTQPKLMAPGEYAGEIRAFGGSMCPNNWLIADGTELPTQGHTALNNAIGDLWGATQQTTFMLPDLRGVFVRGWNRDRANNGDPEAKARSIPQGAPYNSTDLGNQVGTYQQDQFLSHNHTLPLSSRWGDKYSSTTGFSNDDGTFAGLVQPPTNSAGGTETRPRNVYVLYCIRDGN
jgi:microcystin-dependent protein